MTEMNLIKQLGGYEKAKNVAFLQRAMGLLPHANRTDKALLNYRREHNIFEVGDKVVSKVKQDSINQIFEIERVGRNGELYDTAWRMLHIDFFRHATDEEIKVGKRLEVSK